MGLAEVFPGVSGGTIAFVTGIYNELIESLARITRPDWSERGLRKFGDRDSITFLATVVFGMLIGLAGGALVIYTVYRAAPLVLWGLVFGLMVGAAIHVARTVELKDLVTYGLAGICVGIAMGELTWSGNSTSLWLVLVGGTLACGAWMLPGVSGAFILLLLGIWQFVWDSIFELIWPPILVLVAGMLIGLVVFSQGLRILLHRIQKQLVAVFTGLIVGSLWHLWPWQIEYDAIGPPEVHAPEIISVAGTILLGFAVVVAVDFIPRHENA